MFHGVSFQNLRRQFHSTFHILPADKIPRCHAEDTSCVVKVANFFVREFKNGDKQLDIPQLDPYIYNSPILISPSAGGSFSLNMEGRNNKLSGLSTETFKKAV